MSHTPSRDGFPAIRWDDHRQLYDGRFTYDRRYSP